MPRTSTLSRLALSLVATSATGCSTGEEACHDHLDQVISDIEHLPLDAEGVTDHGPTGGTGGSCQNHRYTRTTNVQNFVGAFDQNQHLWPGSVLHGAGITHGEFQPILLALGKITFSVSLENLNSKVASTMNDPSLSTYRQTIRDILSAGVSGATPANIDSKITRVETETDVEKAIGGHVGFGPISASAAFSWGRSDIRHRYVVRYLQRYYTIDVDPPRAPSQFFSSRVCVAKIENELTAHDPPVYVSRIVYGRMVLLTFESASTVSKTEFEAAIAAAIGPVTVGGSIAQKYRDIVNASTITAFIYGGSGGDGAQGATSYDGVISYINKGGNYSNDSPGAPLEFQLAYLDDATSATFSLSQDYEAPNCSDTGTANVRLRNLVVAAGNKPSRRVYGTVSATYAGQSRVLWKTDRDQAVDVQQSMAWPSSDQGAEIGSGTFSITPAGGSQITIDAHLKDVRSCLFCSDADLGQQSKVIDLKQGWRQEVLLRPTGDGATTELAIVTGPQ